MVVWFCKIPIYLKYSKRPLIFQSATSPIANVPNIDNLNVFFTTVVLWAPTSFYFFLNIAFFPVFILKIRIIFLVIESWFFYFYFSNFWLWTWNLQKQPQRGVPEKNIHVVRGHENFYKDCVRNFNYQGPAALLVTNLVITIC